MNRAPHWDLMPEGICLFLFHVLLCFYPSKNGVMCTSVCKNDWWRGRNLWTRCLVERVQYWLLFKKLIHKIKANFLRKWFCTRIYRFCFKLVFVSRSVSTYRILSNTLLFWFTIYARPSSFCLTFKNIFCPSYYKRPTCRVSLYNTNSLFKNCSRSDVPGRYRWSKKLEAQWFRKTEGRTIDEGNTLKLSNRRQCSCNLSRLIRFCL